MDQDTAWYGDIGIGRGDVVLDGDPASAHGRGAQQPQLFAVFGLLCSGTVSGVAGPLAAWCCGQICRPIVVGFEKWIDCLKPRVLMPNVTCSIYSILVSS